MEGKKKKGNIEARKKTKGKKSVKVKGKVNIDQGKTIPKLIYFHIRQGLGDTRLCNQRVIVLKLTSGRVLIPTLWYKNHLIIQTASRCLLRPSSFLFFCVETRTLLPRISTFRSAESGRGKEARDKQDEEPKYWEFNDIYLHIA